MKNEIERMFDRFNSLSIGFNEVFKNLQTPSSTGYPPHNIFQTDDSIILELAVAGFKKEEVNITSHQGEITIQGEKTKITAEPNYKHQGIASRQFIKRFYIAEYYEISEATLEDGMLTVKFVKNLPDQLLPKRIPIK